MKVKVLVLAMACWVSACNGQAAAPDEDASSVEKMVNPPVATNALACPSNEFPEFLTAFIEDEQIQRAYVRDPLAFTAYDPQDLEGDPQTNQLSAGEVQFPVIISAAKMREHGVSYGRERKSDTWYQVHTKSDGTGAYTITFDFRHMDGCWYLIGMEDVST